LCDVPRARHCASAKPLSAFGDLSDTPREAMPRTYLSAVDTMQEIAEHFGVHCSMVSCAVRRFECADASLPPSGSTGYLQIRW
jgi:hypothetical protein